MAILGLVTGAVFAIILFRALFLWIARKFKRDEVKTVCITHTLLAIFLIVVPSYGNASGGELNWESGLTYIPIQFIFLIYDLKIARMKKPIPFSS